jgi:hypothetical protein
MALSNVRWKGLKAIEQMSKYLPQKIINQKMRKAFRTSLIPIRDKMRNNIPQKTGRLWYATDITINVGSKIEDFWAVVGPRRKRGRWNMQGWHANIIEGGSKRHVIRVKNAESMPVFKSGRLLGFSKEIEVEGVKAKYPFKRAIDSSWNQVGKDFSDNISQIMREEIENIKKQYGGL